MLIPLYDQLPFDHPETCVKCKCNLLGTKSLNESVMCDSDSCVCKNNVQGVKCDECKNGYWNLSSTNHEDGCTSNFFKKLHTIPLKSFLFLSLFLSNIYS